MPNAEELRQALHDAATSLETLASLSGRKTYGDPPIETHMDTFMDVRLYAAARAKVAREALADARVPASAEGCAAHGLAHPCEACAAELPYRVLLEHWKHESHLQTFEDRERFRKEVGELLDGDGVQEGS